MDQVQALRETATTPPGTLIGRMAAFLYGIAAYGVFLVTFVYAVGFVENLVAPKTIDSGVTGPPTQALIINVVLMSIFALQHSVMARPRFKRWWTRFVPHPIERTTFVLLASLALVLLMWQWRPMATVVWHTSNAPLALAISGLSFLGWFTVLSSTFLINHFELFGLHQVTNHLTGRAMPAPRLCMPLFYRFVRHPLYLGFIIAFWAAPTMTIGHLLFAAVTTAYIFVGISLEERDLIAVFGEEYRRYRERVSAVVPWRKAA